MSRQTEGAGADREGRHSLGTALFLNCWIGQREADLLRLPRNVAETSAVTVRQNKTRRKVRIPIDEAPQLVARIEAEIRHQEKLGLAGVTLLVSERTRQPYTADGFRKDFAEIRAIAAAERPTFPLDYLIPGPDGEDLAEVRLEDLWFAWSRQTAVTMLSEARVDDNGISAITGHSLASIKQILEHYLIRTTEGARVAIRARVEKEQAK